MVTHLTQQFEKVFIDIDSIESSVAQRALELFEPEKIEVVGLRPYPEVRGILSAKDYERSKRQLFLTPFKGNFFKRCPGAKGVACCNYFVLNLGVQCDMDCSYCYLQSYINTPILTVYTNIGDALQELEQFGNEHAHLNYRIGTGETTDSLSLDPLTLFSIDLIGFFKRYPNWNLELKTKSDYVDQFLDMDHMGNITVSWSINPPYIIASEEHRTAPLKARLAAARKCLDRGYKVGLHIDPLIWHNDWKQNYSELVDEVSSLFTPQEVPSVTLGGLRFQPEQRHLMRERFGIRSLVNQGELFLAKDGKWRYDRELRNLMFQFVIARFKEKDPLWNIWFCMENVESWVTSLGGKPTQIEEIRPYFEPLPKPKKELPLAPGSP